MILSIVTIQSATYWEIFVEDAFTTDVIYELWMLNSFKFSLQAGIRFQFCLRLIFVLLKSTIFTLNRKVLAYSNTGIVS